MLETLGSLTLLVYFVIKLSSHNVVSRDNQQERAYICVYMDFDIKKIKPEIGYYLAGFADAEGSFYISFSPKKNVENKTSSWNVKPAFTISQKERHIVAQFKKHLKCGTVNTNKKTNVSVYSVTNLRSLRNQVVVFFKKFHFQSAKKKRDFCNFIQVLKILEKTVLNTSDIEKILALRINTQAIISNRVYSDIDILSNLQQTVHISKIKQSSETNTPNSENIKNILYNEMIESNLYGDIKARDGLSFYIAGFVDGDGSFNVSFRQRDDYRLGWKINPSFSIAQRDKNLLQLFAKKLGCGKIRQGSSEGIWYLEVVDSVDLRTKIVPFFKTYCILSKNTQKRFENFCLTLDILIKKPLNRSDVEEILILQRSSNNNARYSKQDVLARVDVFLSKQNNEK